MRLRLRFTKLGKVRFISHRDVARVWERVLRRAGVPVAITEGFSPRPKVHFGLALSTGHESLGEYLDVDLHPDATAPALEPLAEQLSDLLPPGMEVEAIAEVDRRATSLQQAVTSCTWLYALPDAEPGWLSEQADRLLGADELPVTRTRKGKTVHDDLRPAVVSLEALERLDIRTTDRHPEFPSQGPFLRTELSTQPRGVRPQELLDVFDRPLRAQRTVRLHQWITLDGARHEPLLAATRAPHVTGPPTLAAAETAEDIAGVRAS
ncbi:MAG: DUF2344 domain-containing protein [Acidimicrobiia bacterium]|nr:DUF2344 domain-containing protein [Acidimicrobiia bacterium]